MPLFNTPLSASSRATPSASQKKTTSSSKKSPSKAKQLHETTEKAVKAVADKVSLEQIRAVKARGDAVADVKRMMKEYPWVNPDKFAQAEDAICDALAYLRTWLVENGYWSAYMEEEADEYN